MLSMNAPPDRPAAAHPREAARLGPERLGPRTPRGRVIGDCSLARTASESLLALDLLAVALKRASNRIALPLARAARAFTEREAWTPFGSARIEDHARERFGRTGRWIRDLAALGKAL